jgi:cytochrome o ubiquinol oxidase subunit 2
MWGGSAVKRNNYLGLFKWFSLCATALLVGCSQVALFDPKGPIGHDERFVIIMAFVLMLLVVVPVLVMALWFPWKYRASNTKAPYTPKWSYSVKIDLAVWLVPVAIVTCLAFLAWTKTHHLDPYQPIGTGVKPIRIEVVSLDWKWLFIYPEHNIASVNQFVFPAKVPLSFRITSDSVITSFFIPQLGSQIYAMAGRESRLHLMADEPGTYAGQNQQFSGRGYSDMNFEAIAVSQEEFETWVQRNKQSPESLSVARFEKLAEPSVDCPVTQFSSVVPGLFEQIIRKYKPKGVNPEAMSKQSDSLQMKPGALEEG